MGRVYFANWNIEWLIFFMWTTWIELEEPKEGFKELISFNSTWKAAFKV